MKFDIILLLSLLFCSCQTVTSEKEAATTLSRLPVSKKETATEVKTMVLASQNFQKEIISQGRVEAQAFSDITFDVPERIEVVLVKTGQRVKKGDLLAKLRDFEWQNQLQKVEHQIERAQVDLESKLISLGYNLSDTLDIPPAVLKTATLESNLKGLELEKELIRYKLKSTQVRAPISGIVGEVEAQTGSHSSAYKKLCSLIDDRNLQVVFPILEQELPLVQVGQDVSIQPLHQAVRKYTGKITSILPQVGEHGMIKVFAKVKKVDHLLLDGMHVNILIQENVRKQLVIPKSAVVDRQGRQLVFTYKAGQAHWTYVELGLENSTAYTVVGGLAVGDEVIVSNNFHLSHLEEVSKVEH